MPDKRDAYILELEERIDQLRNASELYEVTQTLLNKELGKTRHDAGLVVHALDCAIALIEQLILFLPDGSPVPDGVATCKAALDRAMSAVTGKRRVA